VKRLPNWLFALGALFAMGGLLLLPAGAGGEESALAGGAIMFSTGILIIALGLYLKARLLQAEVGQAPKTQRKKDKCEACEAELASIRCSLHDIKLCTSCLPHHDISSCTYVPLTRKAAAASAR